MTALVSKALADAIRSAARADAVDHSATAKAIIALSKDGQHVARAMYLSAFISKRMGCSTTLAATIITMAEHGRQPKAGQATRSAEQQAAFGAGKTAFTRLLAKAEVKSTGKNAGNKSRTVAKKAKNAAKLAEVKAKAGKAAAKVAVKLPDLAAIHAQLEVFRAGMLAMLNANANMKGLSPYRAIVADFGKGLDTIPAAGE